KGQTLWQALGQSTIAGCRDAAERLTRWRNRLDFERPFEFLAQLLYAEGGLRRFHARLGTEVDDVFAELLAMALDHEQSSQPSLQGFVAALRGRRVSVKRELAESGGGVRVMTVHGAKGLEAPIVILADASRKVPATQVGKPVYLVTEPPGPLMIHAAGRKQHLEATRTIKQGSDDNLGNEYWRLLYVAMTRAEDELYVTGALTPGSDAGTQLAGSWYEAIETALRPHASSVAEEEGPETALIYPRQRVAPLPVVARAGADLLSPEPLIVSPLPAFVPIPKVSPSLASGHIAPIAALDSL